MEEQKGLEYKIFVSEDYDWYVLAKKTIGTEGEPQTLYTGHDIDRAYEAALSDMGIKIPVIEKDMEEEGTYTPRITDFE